ncbi:unnamed protein product, partial [Dovyalis caffra]
KTRLSWLGSWFGTEKATSEVEADQTFIFRHVRDHHQFVYYGYYSPWKQHIWAEFGDSLEEVLHLVADFHIEVNSAPGKAVETLQEPTNMQRPYASDVKLLDRETWNRTRLNGS